MKKTVLLAMLTSSVMLSSCMTVFTKAKQPITIQGESGVALYDARNNVKLGVIDEGGTTTLMLKKKTSDQTIIAKKKGYSNTPFVIESCFNSKSLWNILFLPGFLIDLGTGRINKFDPVIYNLEMKKETASAEQYSPIQ